MFKQLYPVILIIILSSFSLRSLNFSPSALETSNDIRENVAKRLSKKYNMEVFGEGIEIPNYVLKLLGIDFQIHGPLSKEELRRILVDCVEELLCAINSSEKIRPFLETYPFTSKNIDISLYLIGPDRRSISPPDICIAAARSGSLIFRTHNSSDPNDYVTEEESYEDALKLLGHKLSCLQ